ncbi:MAG: carbohydrate ABC transporter permease [Spirochaetales bacterium]|nr:carbohydrate ABC transporter permease [Spirochaetales bacterium]
MVILVKFCKKFGFFLLIMFIVLFSLFPFIQMLSTSLKYSWDWGNPSLMPAKINIEAYRDLLGLGEKKVDLPESIQNLLDETPDLTEKQRDAIIANYLDTGDVFPFGKYFLNSILFSLSAAAVSLILSVFGAYSISRLKFRGSSFIRRGILFVYMFGGILLLIPLYKISVALGLGSTEEGTVVALVIIYVVQTLPVSLYMLGNFFRSIPYSIEEAAYVEGCSQMQTIWKIIIPLSLAALATVFVYSFMIAWNEYLYASVFLKSYENLFTLPLGLKALFVSKNAIWDRIMAASMLTAIPVVILFMFVQKYLAGNLASGGVKE